MARKKKDVEVLSETLGPEIQEDFLDGMNAPLEASGQAEPETVTLNGSLLDDSEDGITFLVIYGDEAGTEAEFEIPREQVLSLTAGSDEADQRTVSRAYALEAGLIAAPEDAEDAEPGASTIPNDRHWLGQEQITVTQELTQKEKAEYAEEMAAASGEKDRLEAELDGIKKQYKRLIDAEDSKISTAAKIVREGKEEREIFCDKLADYNTCEIVWTDAYGENEEVKRRKMTAKEKQLPLEKKTKPDQTPQEPAQAEAEGEELDSQPEGAIMPEDAIGCSVCAHSDGDGSTDAECCHECDDELSNFTPLSIPQEQPANAGAVQ